MFQHLSRRRFLQRAGATIAAAGLMNSIGPGPWAEAASRELALPPPNGGKPITLTVWTPYPFDTTRYNGWFKAYKALYPNVSFQVTTLPLSTYFQKVEASTQVGSGPDINLLHAGNITPLLNAGLLVPYPESLFPMSRMQKEYNLAGQQIVDGKMYLFPLGTYTDLIYYNKKLWSAAGLTDKDIPTTWDDLGRLAQQLTVRKNGKVVQWGCNVYTQEFVFSRDPYYQLGGYLYSADGRQAAFNNDLMRQAVDTYMSFVTKYKATAVSGTGTDGPTTFGQGRNAMTVVGIWLPIDLLFANPKLLATDLGYFPLPNYTGKASGPYGMAFAMARWGVMKWASSAAQETAFHFLYWRFMTGDRIATAMDYAEGEGADLPAYLPAQVPYDTNSLGQYGSSVVREEYNRLRYLGDIPDSVNNALEKMMQEVALQGVPPRTAIAQAAQTVNHLLHTSPVWTTERQHV